MAAPFFIAAEFVSLGTSGLHQYRSRSGGLLLSTLGYSVPPPLDTIQPIPLRVLVLNSFFSAA